MVSPVFKFLIVEDIYFMSYLSMADETGLVFFDVGIVFHIQPDRFRVIPVVSKMAGYAVLFKDTHRCCDNSILPGYLLVDIIEATGFGVQFAQKPPEFVAIEAVYILVG